MMRSTFLLIFIFLLFEAPHTKGQNILFQEDFESTPVDQLKNDFGDTLWTGSSWCEQAARGMTSHHNSGNVDFNSSENGGYFLANNPEDSCNGFNTATVVSDSLDFSGVDSIFFSTRYFIGDSIGWGPRTLTYDIMTSTDTFTVDTVFKDTSTWGTVDMRIPDNMIDDTVWFEVELGGGEAVGVDDITFYSPMTSNLSGKETKPEQKLEVHPNPFQNRFTIRNPYHKSQEASIRIIDMTGRIVRTIPSEGKRSVTVDGSELEDGIYVLEVLNGSSSKQFQRIVKR